jgi:hypothetical protein
MKIWAEAIMVMHDAWHFFKSFVFFREFAQVTKEFGKVST